MNGSRLILALLAVILMAGCGPSIITSHPIGRIPDPWVYVRRPEGLTPATAGVLEFDDLTGHGLGSLAAEELTKMACLTGRFRMIGRAEVEDLLKKSGIDRGRLREELSTPGRIRGVDCLLQGEVVSLQVSNMKADEILQHRAELGVRVKVVSPRTGEGMAESRGTGFSRVKPGTEGIPMTSGGNWDPVDVRITREDQVKLLQSGLKEMFFGLLEPVDWALTHPGMHRCPKCEKECGAEIRLCPGCGADLAKPK
jgi:hypothetical protein